MPARQLKVPNEQAAVRAEQGIIGLACVFREALDALVCELKPADYSRPLHADLHRALAAVHRTLGPNEDPSIDKLVLALAEVGAEEQSDGTDVEQYVASCIAGREFTIIDAPKLIDTVKRCAAQRHMWKTCHKLLQETAKPDADPYALAELFKEQLSTLRNGSRPPAIVWAENATEQGTTEWLIDALLPKQGIVILAGEPGSGKTTLCAEWAWHLATGQPLWDKPVEQGRVLWLGFDDPFPRIKAEKLELLGELPPQTVCAPAELTPLNERTLAHYVRLVRQYNIRLVVADTIFHWLEVAENKLKDSGPVHRAMALLREFVREVQVCVLGIWHLNKDQLKQGISRLADSTQLAAGADTVLLLLPNHLEPELCTLEFAKDRLGNSHGMQMRLLKRAGRFIPTEESPKPQTLKERIYATLCERGQMDREAIMALFEDCATPRAIDKALQALTGRDGKSEPVLAVSYDGPNRKAVYSPMYKVGSVRSVRSVHRTYRTDCTHCTSTSENVPSTADVDWAAPLADWDEAKRRLWKLAAKRFWPKVSCKGHYIPPGADAWREWLTLAGTVEAEEVYEHLKTRDIEDTS